MLWQQAKNTQMDPQHEDDMRSLPFMIRCISVRATQRPTLVRVRVGRRGSSQSLFTWFQWRSSLWSVAAITIDVERSAPLAPEKSSRPKIVIYSSFSGDCSGQRANVEPGSSEP